MYVCIIHIQQASGEVVCECDFGDLGERVEAALVGVCPPGYYGYNCTEGKNTQNNVTVKFFSH